MTEQVTRAGWQQLAAELLERYRGELARHGISLGADLHLEPDGNTPYSYCDLATGRISLNLPGTDRFADLLLIMAVGGLLGTKGLPDTVRALRALLPYLLGHELAHYLRERFGAFTPNRWVEEHVSNRMGMALACTVPAFAADLDFLRRLAEGAHERLPLRDDQVVGVLRETHGTTVDEVLAFADLTGVDELETLRAAGLEAEVAALSHRRDQTVTAFNASYLTDATAYMRQQLAWFCQQVLEPEPPELGAELEAHVLTASWEERLQAETAAVLHRLAEADEPAEPAWSRAERLAMGAGADDRLRAIALEQLRLAGDTAGLLRLLEQAAASCRRYAALQAQADRHEAPRALREALSDAYHLALEVGAEAAGVLAGIPLHVVRVGLGSQMSRSRTLTLGLVRRRLAGEARNLAASLLYPDPGAPMAETQFRQAVMSDPDPLVATEAGATGRLERETLTELSFFRTAPLLRTLRGTELLPLAEAATEISGVPGTVLTRRGDRPERLFLTGGGRLIGLVEALSGAAMRRAVKLPAGQRILGITAPAFLAICREEPKLSRAIALHLARRVWDRRAPHLPDRRTVAGPPLPDRPLLPAEKALALLDTDLFGPHGSQALQKIAEAFVTRFHPPGESLVVAHSAPRLLVVVSGRVQVGGAELGAGAVLGDTECLVGRPWRHPVTAVTQTVTLEAEQDDFQRLLYALPDLPYHLAHRQASRLGFV